MSKQIAFVTDGVVTNIAMYPADYAPTAGQIDVTNLPAGIGWSVVSGVPVAPAPEPVPPQTVVARSVILGRMTAGEMHAWRRAVLRAESTNSPVAADRDALYAWYRFQALPDDAVDLTRAEVTGLKSVWMGLGMAAARADAILARVTT